MSGKDEEANRFTARAARYARVGTKVGRAATRMIGGRLFGSDDRDQTGAVALAGALGGLKGPIMKVAQLLATIPELLPPEYGVELQKLQSAAPPMGSAFVRRRMAAELGPDWRDRFGSFDLQPAAAASLGQVHRATDKHGRALACKLQYPDMQSAVEADLKQLELVFSVHRYLSSAIDTREIMKEISERIREELDYVREARHARLYADILNGDPDIRVPAVFDDLSTSRLLSLEWLEGQNILEFVPASQETRNHLAKAMFRAWWHPFTQIAVIHGDPHLGNYTVFPREEQIEGINLFDFGCVRIFPPSFVGGVVGLYRGLIAGDRAGVVHAYETWGFENLSNELIDILNIWARFIFAPLLEDRTRTIADGVKVSDYGRREAFLVHRALKEKGPVRVPREFVFMDRAAIGLGGVFLHLRAEVNFHRLFEAEIADLSVDELATRQKQALIRSGLESLEQ